MSHAGVPFTHGPAVPRAVPWMEGLGPTLPVDMLSDRLTGSKM